MTFDTVLVANRGEIARRVMATCRARGIRTVAVHAAADADALHVHEADVAVELPGAPVAAYLDVDAVLDAAEATGADAIHPGYGFLSENAALPRACAARGVTFIGPSADVIELMGDKAASKRAAAAAGVPVLRSIDPAELTGEELRDAVTRLGLPVIVKAVAGGGGKGMRRVDDLDDLDAAVTAAGREARSAFGDDRLLVEPFVAASRHVEIQVAGDDHGGAVHLFERDCSIQRRHQKVVEEAPSPALDPALRGEMGAAAVALVEAVGYTNLGTVEFLLDVGGDGRSFSFLEMNTRLQVEHPVTEFVTGLDLVGCQLDIAAGGHVPTRPDEPVGHAIEVRLYAEDVPAGFLPQAGRLHDFTIAGDGVRVDSGFVAGSDVTSHYDPMLAKVIAHGPDRDGARRRLVAALGDAVVTGVVTNLGHLLAILRHPVFVAGDDVTTAFLPDHLPTWAPEPLDEPTMAAVAGILARAARGPDRTDPWQQLGPWRGSGVGGWRLGLGDTADDVHWLTVTVTEEQAIRTTGGQGPVTGGVRAHRDGDWVWVSRPGHGSRRLAAPRRVRHVDHVTRAGAAALTAPMPGQVAAVEVAEGDAVAAGDVLAVIEAMKMEHPIVAPGAGVVTDVSVVVGDTVAGDQPVVAVEVQEADA